MLDVLNNKIIEELIEDVLLYGDCEFDHVIDKDIEAEERFIDGEYVYDGDCDVFPEANIREYTIKVDIDKNAYIINGKAETCYEVEYKGFYEDEDNGGHGTVHESKFWYDIFFTIIISKGEIIEKRVHLMQ